MDRDFYRQVFMDAPEALMIAMGGVIEEVNNEAARLLGARSPEEVAGREMGQILPMGSSVSHALHSAMAHLSRGDLRSFDMEISLPGPVFFPVVMRVSGLGGGMVAISLRDATSLRRLERDLQRAIESASALVDTCPLPVFRIDSDYRFVQIGPSLSRLTGWEAGDLLGRKCHEILTGRESVCAGCPAALSRISGGPVSTVISDSQRHWRSSAAALGGRHGAGAVVFIEDLPPARAGSSEPSALSESLASHFGTSEFDETCALATAEERPFQEVFACDAGPAREGSASLLAMIDAELSERLGRRVRVLPAVEHCPARVSVPGLLHLVRGLAEADLGACLVRDSDIILRVDRLRVPGTRSAISGFDCLALSMGSSEDLAVMSAAEMLELSRNPVSDDPGRVTTAGSLGVFVARSRAGEPFYQILLRAEDSVR